MENIVELTKITLYLLFNFLMINSMPSMLPFLAEERAVGSSCNEYIKLEYFREYFRKKNPYTKLRH